VLIEGQSASCGEGRGVTGSKGLGRPAWAHSPGVRTRGYQGHPFGPVQWTGVTRRTWIDGARIRLLTPDRFWCVCRQKIKDRVPCRLATQKLDHGILICPRPIRRIERPRRSCRPGAAGGLPLVGGSLVPSQDSGPDASPWGSCSLRGVIGRQATLICRPGPLCALPARRKISNGALQQRHRGDLWPTWSAHPHIHRALGNASARGSARRAFILTACLDAMVRSALPPPVRAPRGGRLALKHSRSGPYIVASPHLPSPARGTPVTARPGASQVASGWRVA